MKRSLSAQITETLLRYPDNVLIADQHVSWTGSEVEAKIRNIREHLEASTLENSLVGVCFPNFAYQGLAILAALQAKRIPVILSYTDLNQQAEKWMDRLHLDLLISTQDLNDKACEYFQVLSLSLDGEVLPRKLREGTFPLKTGHIAPRGTALVLYTSGSTGEAKGICVPEEGIKQTCSFLMNYFDLDEQTVTPIVLPVCHSMALNTQFLPTFFAGGKSTFFNSRLGMNKLFRHINQVEGTFISLIGEVLRVCWEEMKVKNLGPNLLVKHVQLAGGIIQEKHLKMASELFPNAVIHKGYGLTEGIRVTMIDQTDPGFLQNIVGKPLPFQQVQIRDEHGSCLPLDAIGEVFVKGPNIMMGMLGSNVHPTDEAGYLATGDLGSMNCKGQLSIYGRKDSVFKINGLKVSGVEIERIAASASSFVREAKCLAVEDDKKARNKIVLFLEIPSDKKAEFLNGYFESFYKALWDSFRTLNYFPKDIILTSRFPKTSNGKLSLQGLRNLWAHENKSKLSIEVPGTFLFYTAPELLGEEEMDESRMGAL